MVDRWLSWLWTLGGLAWLAGAGGTVGRATAAFARLPRLSDARLDAGAAETGPSVSVVVAARNEAATLPPAIGSLLASDHRQLEVVAVDDRSSDRTADILDELARGEPRLRVLHVGVLPQGWLGKNHALQRGAEAAGGQWLLFTDADVRFAPEVVRRAVVFAQRAGLDHVTAVPALIAPGPGLRVYMVWMLLVFAVWRRPWQASRPDRRASAGMGAFNLVRREAYWGVGGHAAIPLALADDVALGCRLKAGGYRQTLVVAAYGGQAPLLEIQWYPDLRGAVRGFEKNAFAMFRFQPWAVAGWALTGTGLTVAPLVALVLAPGWARLPWAAGYVLTTGSVAYAGRVITGSFPWLYGLLFPAAQAALGWTVVRSAWIALWRGGVRWRDTFYPLRDLRAADRGPARPRRSLRARQAEDLLAPRH